MVSLDPGGLVGAVAVQGIKETKRTDSRATDPRGDIVLI